MLLTPNSQGIVWWSISVRIKLNKEFWEKTDRPDLLELDESDESVKQVFCDQFDEVPNFLHLTDVFNDSRVISTTYLERD